MHTKGNFEEELPKPTVGKLSAGSGPTANQQATDRSIRPYNKSKIISLFEQFTNRTHVIVSKLMLETTHSSVLLDQNKL